MKCLLNLQNSMSVVHRRKEEEKEEEEIQEKKEQKEALRGQRAGVRFRW